MKIEKAFEEFIDYLQDIAMEDKVKRIKRITKKLNQTYYNGNESEEEHFLLIGSLGRGTAIKNISDVDIAFEFPQELYDKYDSRKNNGQSDLLQDIKDTLLELSPRTIVRGDGQVVVMEYTDYEVEICPFFYEDENSYLYPDAKHGGTWKTTKPVPEINESVAINELTGGNFKNICNVLRAWKNEQGFVFGGLLIDTLVYNFFVNNDEYYNSEFSDYPQLLKDLFKYLKDLNKEQDYWLALGSNQRVYNKDSLFITKAKSAYNAIKDLDNESDEMHTKLRSLFGNKFPGESLENNLFILHNAKNTEEFIEEQYKIDIRYPMEIFCNVSQDGWRDKTPLKFIRLLKTDKDLEFQAKIPETIKEPYDIKWKVRNVGELAHRKNQIRGQIIDGSKNKHIRTEKSSFKGPHYVEAYVIKNDVVIARARVDVPINIKRK
ncbi:MAG TPA: nucleotidyltransferase domain-containing protein [Chitinophagaceae bacterium]|nr:nucleotidyltransferase domain-containing protein [Chitinophagaceae bacterium]